MSPVPITRSPRIRSRSLALAFAVLFLASCDRSTETESPTVEPVEPAPIASPAAESAAPAAEDALAEETPSADLDVPPLPDFQAMEMEPDVVEELRRLDARARELASRSASTAERAAAVGELGRHYHAYELDELAAECYRIARQLDPGAFEWLYLSGVLAQDEGRLDAAAEHFQGALAARDDDPATILRLGQVELDRGRLEVAAELFERVLETRPDEGYALGRLAQIAAERDDAERAAELFERALAVQPGASRPRYGLALAYRRLGRLDEASVEMERWGPEPLRFADPLAEDLEAIRIGTVAARQRGVRALRAGRFDEAAQIFREVLEVYPDDVTSLRTLALALERAGDPEGAAASYERAVDLAPDDAELHLSLGSLRLRLGRLDAAADAFEKALALRPALFDAHLLLAELRLRQERWAAAAKHYSAVLEARGENPMVRLYRGVARIETGEVDAAVADLEAAFAVLGDERARGELVRGLIRRAAARVDAAPREALASVERAAELAPADIGVAHVLARLLATLPVAELRDGERALELARRAFEAERTPYHAETLAMALATAGRFDEAVEWQRAILAEAGQSRDPALVERLERNLVRYEAGEIGRDAP